MFFVPLHALGLLKAAVGPTCGLLAQICMGRFHGVPRRGPLWLCRRRTHQPDFSPPPELCATNAEKLVPYHAPGVAKNSARKPLARFLCEGQALGTKTCKNAHYILVDYLPRHAWANFLPPAPNFDRHWPNVDQLWPNSGPTRPSLPHSFPSRAQIGHLLANVWPNLAADGKKIVRNCHGE